MSLGLIEPLLPKKERSRLGGRSRHPDRETLSGILFVLHTGIAWPHLPAELEQNLVAISDAQRSENAVESDSPAREAEGVAHADQLGERALVLRDRLALDQPLPSVPSIRKIDPAQ